MIAYHFCFDLTYWRWADWPMLVDARWIAWRSAIVTSFLVLVGVSLALRDARERGTDAARWTAWPFVRRWGQVAMAATLVTAGSAMLFPDSFIYFGVLHFVAVALWLCRRAPRLGWGAVALGAAIIAGWALAPGWAALDPKPVNWIGLALHKPITEDYVPLIPWLGVVLIGCGTGARWVAKGCPAPGVRLPRPIARALVFMGRWSLTIYLVHQPLLLGAMGLVRSAVGQG